MDIRQLKAFIAVFEERNITQAAQRLFLSQPTLSATLRQLEDDVGAALFVRQPRGVAATEEARLLYPQARRLVDQAAALSGQFRQRQAQLALTLGIDADLANAHCQKFLHTAAALPSVVLTIHAGCGGDARLAAEESRCEDELFLPLWNDPFVLALPQGHPCLALPSLDLLQLSNVAWVSCPAHSSHQRLLALHGEHRLGLSMVAQAGSLTLAAQMVAAGIGVAFLPESLVSEHPNLCVRPMSGAYLSRRIGLCYAAQALAMPAVQALHSALWDVRLQ